MVIGRYYTGSLIIERRASTDGIIFVVARPPKPVELACLHYVWLDIRVPKEDVALHNLLD